LTSKPLGRFLRFGLKIGGDGFLVEPQNQGGGEFSGLDLKIDSYMLKIWVSKSSWCFFGFCPQNQTDPSLLVAPQNRQEDATAWDMRRDLAACF
jgi:hypothetical protein